MKAMIVHVPMGFSRQDWSHNYINIMPMGVFAVANHANARGHEVSVMNAAVYGDRDNALRVIFERIETGCDVVGFTLHWHFTAFDVLHAVGRVKERFPDVKTVIGGFVASVYPEQFLARSKALDAVVQGDGELPFTRFLDELARGEGKADLERVPNLHWRDGRGKVVFNGLEYVADRDEIADLDYGLEALHDVREYANGPAMVEVIKGDVSRLETETVETKWFFLSIGRGCTLNCIYCSGCSAGFRRYFGRKGVVVRPVDSVMRTVRQAYGQGFRTYHMSFDPPFKGRDAYFFELFEKMGQVGDDLKLVFEPYRLPPREFLEACSRSFAEAVISLSPCFYDEENMKRYKGYSFSEVDMRRSIAEITAYENLRTFVFYTICGIDRWDEENLEKNVAKMNGISNEFGCQVLTYPMIAEPGSPWVSFPGLFEGPEMSLGFEAFWREWQQPLDRWNERLVHDLDRVNEVYAEVQRRMQNAPFHQAVTDGAGA